MYSPSIVVSTKKHRLPEARAVKHQALSYRLYKGRDASLGKTSSSLCAGVCPVCACSSPSGCHRVACFGNYLHDFGRAPLRWKRFQGNDEQPLPSIRDEQDCARVRLLLFIKRHAVEVAEGVTNADCMRTGISISLCVHLGNSDDSI